MPLLHRFPLGAILCLLSSATGCMGFRDSQSIDTRPWPPAIVPENKPTIRLTLRGSKITYDRKPVFFGKADVAYWLESVQRDFESSGFFSEVRSGTGATDLTAHVDIFVTESGSELLNVLMFATIGVIPTTETVTILSRTTFGAGGGTEKGVIEKELSATIWVELLLLFGMPFSTPDGVFADIKRQLNRSTLREAFEKGYLSP